MLKPFQKLSLRLQSQLDNFEKSDDEHILRLEEVRKVVISYRSLFSEIGKDLETLKNYLRLLILDLEKWVVKL